MSENKITFPAKLSSNNPKSFGIADATEISGHRSVDTISELYAISDSILSILKDGSDAIGQEWFVVSEDCKYRLDNWANRKSSSGWTKLPKQELINTKQSVSEKDQPSGYAGLDSNGKIPIEKTYGTTATVVNVNTYESLPVTGSSGVIYYVSNTSAQYKWSGSAYIDITDGADNAKKNETSIFDCSNGTSTKYYSSLLDAINIVPPVYRTSNRIISYLSTENATTKAVNYQYNGIDSTTWTDLTKWERVPNQSDLAEIRSDLSELEQEQIQGGVYDVSSHNDGAVFESISTLLGSANLSTLIPTSVRRGGMSIRFIQGSVPNSDNNYVQYRFLLSTFTTNEFAVASNWYRCEDEISDIEKFVFVFNNSRRLINDLSATFFGNVSMHSGDKIRLLIDGGFSANRVVVAGTDTLANRIFDGEITTDGIDTEVVLQANYSSIYIWLSGLTHYGNFNLRIAKDLEGEIGELDSRIGEIESYFTDVYNLVDLTTGEIGYFIQPDGSKNANPDWRYIVIDNIQPGKYSFSGGRHFTTYYNSGGSPVTGGSATSPYDEVRDIPSGVATIKMSFPIDNSNKMAVVKSDEIIYIDELGTYPSEKLQVYSKQETDLKIEQEIEESKMTVIRVGANREYTNLIDAFNYAISLNKKTEIRIDAGIYDVYQEIGGDAFVESIPSTATWVDCNPVFLNPVKIIGIGDVTLKLEIPDAIYEAYLSQSTRLSIINTRTSIEVDNINFVIKNCRYAIHDECDGSIVYNGTLHEFKNCSFYFDNGNAALGVGASASKYVFENCSFDTDLSSRSLLYFHTWPVNTGALLVFKSCVAPKGKVHLSIYNANYKTRVFFENTYLARQNAGVLVQPETNDYTTNIFDITCTNVNFSSIVFHDSVSSNPYTPKFYNW